MIAAGQRRTDEGRTEVVTIDALSVPGLWVARRRRFRLWGDASVIDAFWPVVLEEAAGEACEARP